MCSRDAVKGERNVACFFADEIIVVGSSFGMIAVCLRADDSNSNSSRPDRVCVILGTDVSFMLEYPCGRQFFWNDCCVPSC